MCARASDDCTGWIDVNGVGYYSLLPSRNQLSHTIAAANRTGSCHVLKHEGGAMSSKHSYRTCGTRKTRETCGRGLQFSPRKCTHSVASRENPSRDRVAFGPLLARVYHRNVELTGIRGCVSFFDGRSSRLFSSLAIQRCSAERPISYS